MAKVVNLIKKDKPTYRVFFISGQTTGNDSFDFEEILSSKIEGFLYFEGVSSNEFTSQHLAEQLKSTSDMILCKARLERIDSLTKSLEREGERYVSFIPDFDIPDKE